MPRSSLPPTPASSSDIRGKEGPRLSTEKMSFALPPPAIAAAGSNFTQPSHQITSSDFSLPPPPTRSRKIIQMKPKSQQTEGSSNAGSQHTTKGPNKRGASGSSATSAPASKKQPSATSVAGKKIARKTAHSVIERRRRSKMNEEFSVLKDMIPACRDQEMHKLAILQVRLSPAKGIKATQSNFVYRRALTTFATSNSASPISKLRTTPCLIQLCDVKPHRFALMTLRRTRKRTKTTMTMKMTTLRWRTRSLPARLRLFPPYTIVQIHTKAHYPPQPPQL